MHELIDGANITEMDVEEHDHNGNASLGHAINIAFFESLRASEAVP